MTMPQEAPCLVRPVAGLDQQHAAGVVEDDARHADDELAVDQPVQTPLQAHAHTLPEAAGQAMDGEELHGLFFQMQMRAAPCAPPQQRYWIEVGAAAYDTVNQGQGFSPIRSVLMTLTRFASSPSPVPQEWARPEDGVWADNVAYLTVTL
ncbi:MAG: hypothetical protein IPK19_10390 [Chloroflexi bacterium]|nr:hypothetical protein [Chloroflexota bacterium]